MRAYGFGLSSADTLITLQRLHSLAFGFETSAYAEDLAFLPLDGLLKDNPPPLQTKHKSLFTAGVSSASDVNPAWMDDGLELGMMQVRWAASLIDRRRTECTSEGIRCSRAGVPACGSCAFPNKPLADQRKTDKRKL